MHFFSTLKTLVPVLLFFITFSAHAGDGFDNNYISGSNNMLFVHYKSDGSGNALVFGPGGHLSGSYYIDVPQNSFADIGTITQLKLDSVKSHPRSAYLDRVASTVLYYRIYRIGQTPPSWNAISMFRTGTMSSACLTNSVEDIWKGVGPSGNLIDGLGGGDFYLEFYTVSTLSDFGLDPSALCAQDPSLLCNAGISNPGRILSSRFNTTDPCPITYATTLADQSEPSLVQFHVDGPLPVTLASFYGKDLKSSIDLHWTSSAESDFSYYELQRSKDALHWATIDIEYPAFSNTGFRDYQYSDEHPEEGFNYYRLKMVDLDGTFEYSPSLVIKHHYLQPLFAYPNPASNWVQIAGGYADDDAAQYFIRDATGKLIRQGLLSTDRQISVEELSSGWYFISIYTNNSNVGTLKLYKE